MKRKPIYHKNAILSTQKRHTFKTMHDAFRVQSIPVVYMPLFLDRITDTYR